MGDDVAEVDGMRSSINAWCWVACSRCITKKVKRRVALFDDEREQGVGFKVRIRCQYMRFDRRNQMRNDVATSRNGVLDTADKRSRN